MENQTIEAGTKFYITPTGSKSWRVMMSRPNGMVSRWKTYRNYERAMAVMSLLNQRVPRI